MALLLREACRISVVRLSSCRRASAKYLYVRRASSGLPRNQPEQPTWAKFTRSANKRKHWNDWSAWACKTCWLQARVLFACNKSLIQRLCSLWGSQLIKKTCNRPSTGTECKIHPIRTTTKTKTSSSEKMISWLFRSSVFSMEWPRAASNQT